MKTSIHNTGPAKSLVFCKTNGIGFGNISVKPAAALRAIIDRIIVIINMKWMKHKTVLGTWDMD